MQTEIFMLPSHWASYFVNGEACGYEDHDLLAMDQFTSYMVVEYGACWCLSVSDDDSGDFRRYHDATSFDVGACDVAEFTFDITERK